MIVVYGGCFNPITLAHEKIIKHISQLKGVSKVLLVPVGDNYNKQGLINSSNRIQMIELVVGKLHNVELDLIEVKSKKVLTTYETLTQIQKKYPNEKIYFTLGADNLLDFTTWNNSEEILNEFGLLVINRDNISIKTIIVNDNLLLSNKDNIIIEKIQMPVNISSTLVRQHYSNINKINIKNYINNKVHLYIKSKGLYCE